MRRALQFFVVALFAMAGMDACRSQTFALTGYQNLTGPGDAHLILSVTSAETWSNMSLRVEISGAMAGVLLYPRIQSQTDLGYFHLEPGNYTFDVFVVERSGPSLEQSGSLKAHERIEFTIPESLAPPQRRKPIIDLVNLGFMLVGLFVFGLLLLIARTLGRPTKKSSG